ncbi:MAG: phosphonate C-P lyase system protein PhnG [Bosea sp. (in: a-proteobacteria)]
MKTASAQTLPQGNTDRRSAMAVLCQATFGELQGPVAAHWPALGVRDLKPVETGLVMLRGRMGGDGAAFNLGEATVTRAVVEIDGGERGYAFLLGRDKHRARLAAIVDALWQQEQARPAVEREIIAPVAKRLETQRSQAASETAATRVDFFTLVRGED